MNTSPQRPFHPRSHLFTVRLWVEELGHGQGEVRMQVKHILSGETRFFREWSLLVAYMTVKLQEVEHESGSGADSP
jgi:hypothetical protein